MPVTKDEQLLLSNYEVLQLVLQANSDLKSTRSNKSRQNNQQSHLATILYESVKFLEESPCNLIKDESVVRSLMEGLKQYELTKSEKLEIINHLPSSLVELQLLIEDNEERLTEEQLSSILELICSHVYEETDVDGTVEAEMEETVETKVEDQ